MSLFSEDMILLQEERLTAQLEEKLLEKLKEHQSVCEDGEGKELHQSQGWTKAIRFMLDLPGEVVQEAKTEGQTTEE